MGHFWASFFEHIRHCGRNATIFLISLATVCAIISLGIVVYLTHIYRYVFPVVATIASVAVFRLAFAIRRARILRRQRTLYPPLSTLELRNARSKLRKARTQ